MQVHAAQQKAGAGKAVGPVTPAHIKLEPSGEAKLALGEVTGLGYSSPEQTMGGFGDRRSDVFSLGAVLWEALTHQRLFDAMNDAAVRMAVQEREIQAPSEINANVPAELSAICMRALNRNPADRYQSTKAMAVEIEEFLEEAGYADDDTKIASYLAAMNAPPKAVKIEMAPLARPASSTQPPPTASTAPAASAASAAPAAPAAPSMLGEPPRAKSNSGAAVAAALANAGATPATSNGATTASASSKSSTDVGLPPPATTLPAHATPIASAPLPQASYAATAIGVPKLDEWQDPAQSTPQAPLPPVLPSGSTPLRNDKSTISVSVPPQVKVTVEAKHAEAKQPALVVEDKPKAQIVEDKPSATKHALVDDGKTTLVDGRPPEIDVPKLVNGRLPDLPPGATADGVKAEAVKTEAVKTEAAKTDVAKAAAEKPAPLPSQVETVAVKPVRPPSQSETTKRPPSQSEMTKRPPSQSDATVKGRAPSRSEKSQPHPVAAVSLGPGPKDKDVLAGWGWGTDKHNAIAPDGYVGDDDYEPAAHDSRKILLKVIGSGMALVTLIIIVAFAFGGSSDKKKETAAAKVPDPTKPLIDQQRAHVPDTAPAPTGSADVAAAQPAQPTAEEQAAAKAAADAEAARLAEQQRLAEEAKKAEAERLATEQKQAEDAKKAEAERIAAEKKQADEAKQAEAARLAAEKKQADDAKKAENARIAAEKKHADDAKKAESARIAAEKRQAEQAKKQEAARVAAERKAEQQRLAQEKKAEQQRLAQAKKAEAAKAAKTTPKTTARAATTKKTETKVAVADTKSSGKVNAETAYRQGLQQFARGDTSGALASLRTSLAANPNYGPTWRGLGLVFEKMGEKDQARAAYKRYLQLAPGAGDAEQIRGRLERLGS